MRYPPSLTLIVMIAALAVGWFIDVNHALQAQSPSILNVGQSDINLSSATAPSIPPEKFKSMIRTDKLAILTCIAWQAAKTGTLRIGGKGAMDDKCQFAAKHIENLDVEFTDIDGKRWKAQWVEVKPVK